ncbi:peptide chain release factor N(5)-glutamine methyltransferase [Rhodobacteraceae bacterium 63075]|nr:peptide chain release factor N(5)-glutamine methyltransferase [Rhodobacteraceae bacterium 63075]
MAAALEIAPGRLTLVSPEPLEAAAAAAFSGFITRRAGREPVSHILGTRQFYGRDFEVTANVLAPRGDTETLIAEALEEPFETVLDLGTGSGAILVTLLAESAARGTGTDLSEAALAVAARNAERHGVAARCSFTVSDWFEALEGRFDLIVSNPPYIGAEEMEALAPELAHEPRLALTDEGDGLGAYRAICAGAPDHLRPGGHLLVETGWQQGADVAELMRGAGFVSVRVIQDLGGRDRVVRGQKPA